MAGSLRITANFKIRRKALYNYQMKKLLLLPVFVLIGLTSFAQIPSIIKNQAQQMKVEDLTDEQVRQMVAEMKRNKLSFDQIDTYAQQKGISQPEALKLKDRIRTLNLEKELAGSPASNAKQEIDDREVNDDNVTSARDIKPMTAAEKNRMKIFGSELFNNRNLTFEPNLQIPTPPNYQLAAGDELIIDVYGYSEVQHRLKVTPDGYIRVPYVGPVYVNGLTIEEARIRITQQLSTIYGGIKSGDTFVQLSLGNIRSIRVLLVGEVTTPGTYSLSSLSSIANALYLSGGPNMNGSFRDIQVIRNGKPVVHFDLYDFLANGDLTNNIVLRDQDIVKINPYKTRVELTGEVKRPAIFEVKDGETLQDIINFAGGYTDISYKEMVRAYRINNQERELINIPVAEIGNFKPQSGDKYFVDAILNRFSNRVMISGAVLHPGEYALENNMTVADLIKKAAGIKEEASTERAIIFRLNGDYTPRGTSFNINDALSGRQTVYLQREDSIVVYSKLSLRPEYKVKISGEVNTPGYFDYADSLQIEDLILMAGGLKDAASLKRVEVARRIRNREFNPSDSSVAIVVQFDINADLTPLGNYPLQPFDEVIIRKSPTYVEQATVSIDGEILYPGAYTINSKTEKISDLIKRSGGLRPEAYAEGAVLLRKTFVNASDSALLDSKLQIFYNKLEDSTAINRMQSSLQQKGQLVDINLKDIIEKPGSKFDLLLEEGDIIKIPKKLQTVQLFGEIYFPKKVRFDKRITFRDYIRGAGGFTSSALKRRSYIVFANGEVKSTRKVLFFNSYPKVKPGAEIYVPSRKNVRGLSSQEAIGITTGLASLALIVITVLDRIK